MKIERSWTGRLSPFILGPATAPVGKRRREPPYGNQRPDSSLWMRTLHSSAGA
jgi:hypothetical protein